MHIPAPTPPPSRRALPRAEGPAPVAPARRIEPIAGHASPDWQPGDRLTALVVERFGNRHLVDVAGERWLFRLASARAPGDRLALVVQGEGGHRSLVPEHDTDGRLPGVRADDPTRRAAGTAGASVDGAEAPAAPVSPGDEPVAHDAAAEGPAVFAAASGPARYAAVARLPVAAEAEGAEAAELTTAARAIAQAAGSAPPGSQAAVPRPPAAPLLSPADERAAPAPDVVARAAALLREQLGDSGLFYESRLEAWARGALPLAALLRSPQARAATTYALTAPPLSGASPPGPAAPSPASPPAAAPPSAGIAAPSAGEATAPPAAPQAGGDAQGPVAAAGALPASSAPQSIAQAQLALILGEALRWRGEAWPGQPYELAVRDEGAGGGDEERRSCEATLALDLPSLGPVRFTVVVRGERIAVAGRVDGEASRWRLAAASGELADRLAIAGLELAGLHLTAPPADGDRA